ncbi:hypothetical protein RB195_018217 [Necator americanus]|uniref:ADP-ribosylation factor family protein n=1 Tax=Necator americanus TaxID=51031 RepID=A0ABR1CCC7_NECAM
MRAERERLIDGQPGVPRAVRQFPSSQHFSVIEHLETAEGCWLATPESYRKTSSTVVEGMIVSPPSMGTNQRWTVLMAVVPSSNVLLRLRTADVTAALPFMEDNAIIFVVDSSAPERFPEVIRVVEEVVEDSHIDSCQLLLVVNRKATEHTASCPSIASLLGSLPRFGQPIKVHYCDAANGRGVPELLDYLVDSLVPGRDNL